MLALGTAVLIGVIWLLDALGAPTWVVALAWVVPTAAVVGWVLTRPRPAIATDSDDDSWIAYSIQWVLVGDVTPRSAAARFLAAVVFGAPVAWSLVVLGIGIVVGLS